MQDNACDEGGRLWRNYVQTTHNLQLVGKEQEGKSGFHGGSEEFSLKTSMLLPAYLSLYISSHTGSPHKCLKGTSQSAWAAITEYH